MARNVRRSSDAEGLDYFIQACRKIHSLASDHAAGNVAPQDRVRAGINTLFSAPRAVANDGPPPVSVAQSVVSAVTVRLAAGMIVAFGNKSMVDGLGRMANASRRKRS